MKKHFWLALLLALWAAPASAQTTVRIARDQTTIWAADYKTSIAVVPAGAVLTVVRRDGDWYEVIVPPADPGVGARNGFVFKDNVDAEARSYLPQPPRRIGIVGIAQFGYQRFAAQKSFDAVLGQAGGPFYGGGAEVRFGGLFLNASIERFEKTGQRVLVVDGDVFKMGIADTITLTPVAAAVGYRFVRERATPYLGAGVGRMSYREQAAFTDASEGFESRFASYHVLAGVEFRNDWVASAFEVQYTRAPNTIGVAGASAAFHESNLGGLVGRVKVLVGR